MRFLVDTNFIIFLLKGDVGAVQFIKTYPPDCFFLSAVSVAELVHGAYKSSRVADNLHAIEVMLKSFPILSFNLPAAHAFGRIRAGLEKKGELCGPYDMQIAAIAQANECTVVTRNLKEFTRIPGISAVGF